MLALLYLGIPLLAALGPALVARAAAAGGGGGGCHSTGTEPCPRPLRNRLNPCPHPCRRGFDSPLASNTVLFFRSRKGPLNGVSLISLSVDLRLLRLSHSDLPTSNTSGAAAAQNTSARSTRELITWCVIALSTLNRRGLRSKVIQAETRQQKRQALVGAATSAAAPRGPTPAAPASGPLDHSLRKSVAGMAQQLHELTSQGKGVCTHAQVAVPHVAGQGAKPGQSETCWEVWCRSAASRRCRCSCSQALQPPPPVQAAAAAASASYIPARL